MHTETIVSTSVTSWIGDWHLGPSAWTRKADSGGPSFRTLSTPGDLAPASGNALWSFHLGLREGQKLAARILACGFRIRFRDRPIDEQVECIVTEPGILLGFASTQAAPSLFSPVHEIQKSDGFQWLDADGETVVLAVVSSEREVRFCLVAGSISRASAMGLARSRLEKDVRSLFAEEYDRREEFHRRYDVPPEAQPACDYAIERLVGYLRQPEGVFPYRWLASDSLSNELSINKSFSAIAAWTRIDAQVAAELVRSVLACQLDDGSIPTLCSADGSRSSSHVCWPLCVQSVAMVWNVTHDRSLIEYAMPRLQRYLAWAENHYSDRGWVMWRNAQESLVPSLFDSEVVSADIVALLLAEIDTFADLAHETQMELNASVFAGMRKALVRQLEDFLWNPAAACFPGRFLAGDHIERASISSLVPLLWSNLKPSHRNSLLDKLDSPSGFLTASGIPLWLTWEGEEEAPLLPAHQILMMEGIRRNAEEQHLGRLARTLSHRLIEMFRDCGHFADDLGSCRESRGHESGVEASALMVLLASSTKREQNTFLRRVDHHRFAVMGSLVAIVVLCVLAITLVFMARKRLPQSSAEAMANLAYAHYSQGRYDDAIALYKELVDRMGRKAPFELLLGHALFKAGRYQEAEQHYRNAINGNTKPEVARMNLGLALYRQGRLPEAAECYRQVIADPRKIAPEIRIRARAALEIVVDRIRFSKR